MYPNAHKGEELITVPISSSSWEIDAEQAINAGATEDLFTLGWFSDGYASKFVAGSMNGKMFSLKDGQTGNWCQRYLHILKNSPAFIDTPGEYYIDRNKKVAYVYPINGENNFELTAFWTYGALKANETYKDQMFIGGVKDKKGAGVLGQNGNDSYNNLKMLVDLDNNILKVYHDGAGAVWYDDEENSYTEYKLDEQPNLGKILFKYGTYADAPDFHGEDSDNPENSVYWFDNIKVVTVPGIEYIGGTYENGSEGLALTKSLKEEFNFTQEISAEYFDEDGKLLSENAELFILKKNGEVLAASDYSVELIAGNKLVVDSEVKPGDSFEFTMKKDVKVAGETLLKEDFVHLVSFDSAPVRA